MAPPTGLEPASASLKTITFPCRPDPGELSRKVFQVLYPLSYDGKYAGQLR